MDKTSCAKIDLSCASICVDFNSFASVMLLLNDAHVVDRMRFSFVFFFCSSLHCSVFVVCLCFPREQQWTLSVLFLQILLRRETLASTARQQPSTVDKRALCMYLTWAYRWCTHSMESCVPCSHVNSFQVSIFCSFLWSLWSINNFDGERRCAIIKE